MIHSLIECYHRQKEVSEYFEASLLDLALSEKSLGALIWESFYRISKPSPPRQSLESKQKSLLLDPQPSWKTQERAQIRQERLSSAIIQIEQNQMRPEFLLLPTRKQVVRSLLSYHEVRHELLTFLLCSDSIGLTLDTPVPY